MNIQRTLVGRNTVLAADCRDRIKDAANNKMSLMSEEAAELRSSDWGFVSKQQFSDLAFCLPHCLFLHKTLPRFRHGLFHSSGQES
jgi:hypothetical protein